MQTYPQDSQDYDSYPLFKKLFGIGKRDRFFKTKTFVFKLSMTSLLNVFKGETLTPPPLWLMRQAGRYLPEYRELRATTSGFMEAAMTPALAAEITLQPMRRYSGIDAAIIFSDILVTPYALGMDLQFVKGEGPQLPPLDTVPQTLVYDPAKLEPVYEALRRVRAELPADKTLIGFAGSPWTVACYMIAGSNQHEFMAARRWAFAEPERLDVLLDQLVEITADYLIKQVGAGADMLQLFESWAALLAGQPAEFERFIIRPTQQIIARVKAACPDTPIIGFPRLGSTARLLEYAQIKSMSGMGLDWSVDLAWAADNLPKHLVLQGNLDPAVLMAGGDALHAKINAVLPIMRTRPFIFNLGHGIMQHTPPDHVAQLVSAVKGNSL